MDLKIATWNILADDYASFVHNGKLKDNIQFLRFEKRCQKIKAEICDKSPDIIGLQEVDEIECWMKIFDEMDYDIEYVQRPGKVDGCLVAWKRNLPLTMLSCRHVQYDDCMLPGVNNEGDSPQPLQCDDDNLTFKFLRHNVGLILDFELGGEEEEKVKFSFAVTHLYWNPAYPGTHHSISPNLMKFIVVYF